LLFSLSEQDHRAFTGARGNFVAMYCFGCSPRRQRDAGSVVLECHLPELVVQRPEAPRTGRAVSTGRLGWMLPAAHDWQFFSFNGATKKLAEALSNAADDAAHELEFAEAPPLFGSYLGGYPRWDQDPQTPTCPRCKQPTAHLLDWNAGAFLDGALHVFMCDRTPRCPGANKFSWLVEF
jgi:hypothetical protein